MGLSQSHHVAYSPRGQDTEMKNNYWTEQLLAGAGSVKDGASQHNMGTVFRLGNAGKAQVGLLQKLKYNICKTFTLK